MNYCATHNQFYSAHCVYCGPPASLRVPPLNGDAPQPPFNGGSNNLCGLCGQPIVQGLGHTCPSQATGLQIVSTMCARCGHPIFAGLAHVCMFTVFPGVFSRSGNISSAGRTW